MEVNRNVRAELQYSTQPLQPVVEVNVEEQVVYWAGEEEEVQDSPPEQRALQIRDDMSESTVKRPSAFIPPAIMQGDAISVTPVDRSRDGILSGEYFHIQRPADRSKLPVFKIVSTIGTGVLGTGRTVPTGATLGTGRTVATGTTLGTGRTVPPGAILEMGRTIVSGGVTLGSFVKSPKKPEQVQPKVEPGTHHCRKNYVPLPAAQEDVILSSTNFGTSTVSSPAKEEKTAASKEQDIFDLKQMHNYTAAPPPPPAVSEEPMLSSADEASASDMDDDDRGSVRCMVCHKNLVGLSREDQAAHMLIHSTTSPPPPSIKRHGPPNILRKTTGSILANVGQMYPHPNRPPIHDTNQTFKSENDPAIPRPSSELAKQLGLEPVRKGGRIRTDTPKKAAMLAERAAEVAEKKPEPKKSSVPQSYGKIRCALCDKMLDVTNPPNTTATQLPPVCDFCRNASKSILEQALSSTRRYRCRMCSENFHTSKGLSSHMKIHFAWKPYQCDNCEDAFGNKKEYDRHVNTCQMLPMSDTESDSTDDEGSTDADSSLRQGKLVLKVHTCVICNAVFPTKPELNVHSKTVHNVVPKDNKKKGVTRRKYGTGNRRFECIECGKVLGTKSGMQNHMRIHTGDKPYSCDRCPAVFGQGVSLTLHIRQKHTGEKPYSCEVCEKRFYCKGEMNKHFRVHTGEKPYQCEICEKHFAQNSAYTEHVRRHTGEKPHKCHICERAFSGSSNLKRHMLVHSGEKLHTCPVCNKAFARREHVTTHLKSHSVGI